MQAPTWYCLKCATSREVVPEVPGQLRTCPVCHSELVQASETATGAQDSTSNEQATALAANGRELAEVAPPSVLCAICQSPIVTDEERTACPSCRGEYHLECWQEVGGCAVYGCSQVPTAEPLRSTEIPAAYWGQEHKPCPACGREILAAALRCRHCGATFASSRPEESIEFRERASRKQKLPRVRRTVIVLFILCVIPCLAPLGGLVSLVWLAGNRRDLRALPSIYQALPKIGLAAACIQTVMMVLVVLLYDTAISGPGN